MVTMRDEQIEVLEASHRIRRREWIWKQIKEDNPDLCKDVEDQEGLRKVAEAVEDARTIDIIEDEDVIRFATLAFLPESFLNDPWVSSILIRILNRTEWEPGKRLDFLYGNVVNRLKDSE